MAAHGSTAPHGDRPRITYNQGLFLALTVVVIIIIAIMAPDAMSAIAFIGLIIGLYYAYQEAYGGPRRPNSARKEETSDAARLTQSGFDRDFLFDDDGSAARTGFCPGAGKESYSTLPGPEPPLPVSGLQGPPSPSDWRTYPGAIDLDEYESDAEFGARDRTAGDNAYAAEGNEYNLSREDAPQAAPACVDDEANSAEMDVDELMAVQGSYRNEPTRVTAGTMNRRRDLDQYLREEVDEQENRQWWGRHEL